MKPKVSFIVAAYNVEQYLPECIESIQRQTYKDIEIILVNDGSTDRSGEICDWYASKDSRIEVYHISNGGSVRARKYGLHIATGEYVGFVDADDYIEEDMYASLIKEARENDVDFIHTGFWREHRDKSEQILGFMEGIYDVRDLKNKQKFLTEYVLMARKEKFISYSLWSKLYKCELIQKCFGMLPDEQQYGEDVLCLCFCILESKFIQLKRWSFYHYVEYEESLSHCKNTKQWKEELKLTYQVMTVLQKDYQTTYEVIEEQIDHFCKNRILAALELLQHGMIRIPYFYLKDINALIGKRVVIYGAGRVGCDYYTQLRKYQNIKIVAWLDSNWQKCNFDYAKVEGADRLSEYIFDVILIAVSDEQTAEGIKEMLIKLGQREEKIKWIKPENI